MATLESEKLVTEKFLENAINDGNTGLFSEKPKNESEELILDETTNKNPEEIHENKPNDDVSDCCPLMPRENGINDENSDNFEEKPKKETEKFMLNENSKENQEDIHENEPNDVNEGITDSSPLKRTDNKEEIVENLSEKTESSRDQEISQGNEPNEEQTTENNKEGPEEGSEDKTEPKEEWQDLLGSGVIMKKILREGQPDSRPHRSDKCFINYTCRLEEADENVFVDKADNYEMALGEGDVVQGLDVAIGLMHKNERCLLKIGSRLAFGDRGQPPDIPSKATVVFDVELVDVQSEDDFETMTIQDRRRMGNRKRERGNWWYQRGENTLAIQCYRRALDFLDEVENENRQEKPSDSELQQLLEDRLKVLNNMASAQIKMELYDQAQLSLQSVLKCQPNNVKALYRKSKIHVAKNELGRALHLLQKAKSLEPDDPTITKEIQTVTAMINKQTNSEREYARRMFGGASSSSSKEKVTDDKKKSSGGSMTQLWATLGATLALGVAGLAAYKLKYP